MSDLTDQSRPVLARGVRYHWDPLRRQHQLLYPEGLLELNNEAAAILSLCDGRSVHEICNALEESYSGADLHRDVGDFLNRLTQRRFLTNEHTD